MDQKNLTHDSPINMSPENELEKLEREHLDTLLRIERKLDEISQKSDRNTAGIRLIMESLPQMPVKPIKISELSYDHTNNKLWADERYYINFDGKQADLLARLFTKSGKPKRIHLSVDDLVEESYDFASGRYLIKPRTLYLRAKEIEKKLEEVFRTQGLITVTLKEVYFNHD